MRIVYIAAGAGGMYCGACARDVNLLNGLLARGHDVQVVPLYTPLRIDGDGTLPVTPIFYGGINVYLQNISPVFRHTPAFIERLLDSPKLLRWVSQFAIKTRPQELGPMTVSVLAGKDGEQRKELEKLLEYLEKDAKPELVNITNSLLSGIAPELKKRLGVPVLCTLQGEDSFIEAIPEPHKSKAIGLMRKNAAAIDLFLSPGEIYSHKMAEFLDVSSDKINVVRAGVDAAAYPNYGPRRAEPFVVGYLSSITPVKGLDLLVDAVASLVNEQGKDVKLRVAGKILNEKYWDEVRKNVSALGLDDRFEYLGEVTYQDKLKFFENTSVYSLPSRIAESRGMAVMEAMASGIPVIVPGTGVFPEMMEMTHGGQLFASGDPASLAKSILQIMDDRVMADQTGKSAAAGIALHYSAEQMVVQVISEYEKVLNQ